MSRLDRLVRTVVEPLGRLRVLWCAMFRGNPLLWREMGLWEGRPLWRAPVVWAVVAGVLPLLIMMVWFVWEYSVLTQVRGEWDDPAMDQALINHCRMFVSRLLTRGMSAAEILFNLTIIWIVARAWGRDRSKAMRNQIGVSPITLPQLIGARTLLWLAIPLIFHLLNDTLRILEIQVGALLAPHDSAFYCNYYGGGSAWEQTLLTLHVTRIFLIQKTAWWLMMLGLTTRITLVTFRPVLSLALVAATGAILNLLEDEILIFLVGLRRLSAPGSWYLYAWSEFFLLALPAFFIWRGLPAHVARVYGKG